VRLSPSLKAWEHAILTLSSLSQGLSDRTVGGTLFPPFSPACRALLTLCRLPQPLESSRTSALRSADSLEAAGAPLGLLDSSADNSFARPSSSSVRRPEFQVERSAHGPLSIPCYFRLHSCAILSTSFNCFAVPTLSSTAPPPRQRRTASKPPTDGLSTMRRLRTTRHGCSCSQSRP
jgi:hypothetical protein